ncbi:unnamed protein product [Urochloa decumbens]|uniref:SCP domain-containing protein n=1 Tax=Urochloa decumbens TaxID=240449 RepID=A0ABC8WLU7_9POAL
MAGLLVLAVDAVALALLLLAAPTSPHSLHDLLPSFPYGARQRPTTNQQTPESSEPHVSEHHVPAEGALAHEFLEAHNTLRAKYGVPPLRWSSRLARYARRWSSMRRFDCVMMHSPGSPYGENVFWGTGNEWRAADAVASWATEASNFDWRAQACHPGQVCGHFTQVVWNDTEYVGCGRAECFAGGVFITCSYDPPGNWKGEVPLT